MPPVAGVLILWPQIEADTLVDKAKRVRLSEVQVRSYHAGPQHLFKKTCDTLIAHGPDAVAQGLSGIDDAIFLHLAHGVGEQLVGHFRVELPDERVPPRIVAIQIIVPTDNGGIDETLNQIGLFADQV